MWELLRDKVSWIFLNWAILVEMRWRAEFLHYFVRILCFNLVRRRDRDESLSMGWEKIIFLAIFLEPFEDFRSFKSSNEILIQARPGHFQFLSLSINFCRLKLGVSKPWIQIRILLSTKSNYFNTTKLFSYHNRFKEMIKWKTLFHNIFLMP